MIENTKSEKWLSLKISFFASVFLLFFMLGITIFSFLYFFVSEVNSINGDLNSTVELSASTINDAIIMQIHPAVDVGVESTENFEIIDSSYLFESVVPLSEKYYLNDYDIDDYYSNSSSNQNTIFSISFGTNNASGGISIIPTTTINSKAITKPVAQALTVSKVDEKQPMFELARDSLIIYSDGRVVRNGIFNFDTFDIEYLANHQSGIFTQQVGNRYYLFKKALTAENEIIFTREITFIKDFALKMFYIGIIASFIFFILVYVLGHYFIRLFMKPINENNKKLKEYNHNLAHEIKTPLTILNMNLELLEVENESDSDLIVSNREEIEKIKNITDSLLFLSENFQLREIQKIGINDCVKNFVESNNNKDSINVIYSKNEIELEANKNMFERLLKNLTENAFKYSSDKKFNIVISNKKITFSNQVEKCMSQKDLEKIFEAFCQLDYNRNEGGYGLGLTLVKRIVDIFKWKIEARCAKNTFTIDIFF